MHKIANHINFHSNSFKVWSKNVEKLLSARLTCTHWVLPVCWLWADIQSLLCRLRKDTLSMLMSHQRISAALSAPLPWETWPLHSHARTRSQTKHMSNSSCCMWKSSKTQSSLMMCQLQTLQLFRHLLSHMWYLVCLTWWLVRSTST